MSDYGKEEIAALVKLEKAFTEEQLSAVIEYVEFKLKYQSEWVQFEDKDLKETLHRDIRQHRHQENGEVYKPF